MTNENDCIFKCLHNQEQYIPVSPEKIKDFSRNLKASLIEVRLWRATPFSEKIFEIECIIFWFIGAKHPFLKEIQICWNEGPLPSDLKKMIM